ncbi:MAG: GPW/gp25 family protein [Chitinophagaceae bacterium]
MTIHQKQFWGSGWSFPVTFSAGNLQVNTTASEDNINESIHIILQTKKGERNLEPQFGSGLQQFFFRKMDESLKGEIIDAVKVSLLHNEPRITVKDVKAEFADLLNGLVNIRISYVYNQTNTRHNYVFPFYLNEGTNLG